MTFCISVGYVPPSSVQEDGSPILHCQEQVSSWKSLQKEDYLLSRHHLGTFPFLSEYNFRMMIEKSEPIP